MFLILLPFRKTLILLGIISGEKILSLFFPSLAIWYLLDKQQPLALV